MDWEPKQDTVPLVPRQRLWGKGTSENGKSKKGRSIKELPHKRRAAVWMVREMGERRETDQKFGKEDI